MNHRSFALTLALAYLIPLSTTVNASDHLDAPNLGTPSTGSAPGMASRDINDLYAFQSPSNPQNTVLIMTVNPFAGAGATFGSDVSYEFQIDNTGDAVADVTFATTFSAGTAGTQTFTTTRNGNAYVSGVANNGPSVTNGVTAAAGRYEDPFFFDLDGFLSVIGGTGGFNGTDEFAGADITAIVLEIPSTDLVGTDPNIGVQAVTLVGGNQIDRMGRPAINTALIPSGRKQEFNRASPDGDLATFGADVQASIESLDQRGASPTFTPEGLTNFLLPDVLTLDTSNAGGFPNGRGLEDDVIDAALSLVILGETMGVGDMVDGNDVMFPGVFPYLAPSNMPVPEPSSLALAVFALPALGSCLRRRRSRV